MEQDTSEFLTGNDGEWGSLSDTDWYELLDCGCKHHSAFVFS